jgi:hypothetical protein
MSRLSNWWRNKAKAKLKRFIGKYIPALAEKLADEVNKAIDEKQANMDADVESFIKEHIKDGPIEDVVLNAWRNLMRDKIHEAIDLAQEKILNQDSIEETAEELVGKALD